MNQSIYYNVKGIIYASIEIRNVVLIISKDSDLQI
jgi:hypothetical protein